MKFEEPYKECVNALVNAAVKWKKAPDKYPFPLIFGPDLEVYASFFPDPVVYEELRMAQKGLLLPQQVAQVSYYLSLIKNDKIGSIYTETDRVKYKEFYNYLHNTQPADFTNIIIFFALIQGVSEETWHQWDRKYHGALYLNDNIKFNIFAELHNCLLMAYMHMFNFEHPYFYMTNGDAAKVFEAAFSAGMFTSHWADLDIWRKVDKRRMLTYYTEMYRYWTDPSFDVSSLIGGAANLVFLMTMTLSEQTTEAFVINILQHARAPKTFSGKYDDGFLDLPGIVAMSAELKRVKSQVVYDAVAKVRPITTSIIKIISSINLFFEDFDAFLLEMHKCEMNGDKVNGYHEVRRIRTVEENRPTLDANRAARSFEKDKLLTRFWLERQKRDEEATYALADTMISLYKDGILMSDLGRWVERQMYGQFFGDI